MKKNMKMVIITIILAIAFSSCQAESAPQATLTPAATISGTLDAKDTPSSVGAKDTPSTQIKVIAVETFLADIAQNVAGDRLKVASLIPLGMDPHAYEPTPQDVAQIADAQVLIVNGAGFEEWLQKTMDNAGGEREVIEASHGLKIRQPQEAEAVHEHEEGSDEKHEGEEAHHHEEGDPHFWLDPNLVVNYVENIKVGLIKVDPEGKDIYATNAAAYIQKLKELDQWIVKEVSAIPSDQRLLVTNHESLGYFADRYGFKIVGTVLPSVSTSASPSAKEMVGLVDSIRKSGARAIFLETGANPQLALQIASEAGIILAPELYSHSITAADGDAPTYLDMMHYNVNTIVKALKK